MQSKLTETRQSWTYQEDKLLLELIKLYGCTSWNRIAHELQSQVQDSLKIRSPAACRERYQNILNPNLNKSHWTEEEEQQLFNLQQTFGNCWARIASLMPGRSDLLCKNYFYATLRKVLRRLSKSVGLDQSSDLLKQIKPSVLGGIYCNDDSYKNFTIGEEVKKDFQKMIAKYRHTEKSQLRLLTDNEVSYIKTMLNLLFSINNDYITSKKSKRQDRQDSYDNVKVKTITKKESKLESKLSIKFDNSDDIQQQHLTPQIQQNQSEVQTKIIQPLSIQSPQQIMAFQIQPNLSIWPFQSMQQYQPIQYISYAQPYPQIAYSYAFMM